MDNLEQRLKEDAGRIKAPVPPQLKVRIDASLRAHRVTPPVRRDLTYPLWLAASLTGVTAAVVAIVFMNWAQDWASIRNPELQRTDDAVAYSVPEYVSEFERQLPLRTKAAVLTAPLEEELKNLRTDLEKARENVEQDLEFPF
ncbi:MAG: hypothetical protein WD795_12845 [Woeseia sp.]